LLDAADAAGLSLGGSGYRDPQQQATLRQAHCGSSDYDIYDKPASQCSPPTARPGQSMHEQGLAVDFTSDGSIVTSRSSAAYRWLQGNASRYGLYNLPSEPWHWSVNGD
jgi:LAS superfamily LD-carboxypeptidase LdcB